jgi:5'-nucleotidase
MRILITNDDGIHAAGLKILEEIARTLSDDVWIVAPETDQSGVSHSLSLNDPLRLREVAKKHYAVKGTPTDCVIMGVQYIMQNAKPDLILSGVNRGQNVADDVTYSGTIAAAMEGTILGIPSIALSQAYGAAGRAAIRWDCARFHAETVIRTVLKAGIPSSTVININFPDCAPGDVKGISPCVQGKRDQGILALHERMDGRGNPYFWIGFSKEAQITAHGTDLAAIANNHIAVTPLKLDLTDEPTLTHYAQIFADGDR